MFSIYIISPVIISKMFVVTWKVWKLTTVPYRQYMTKCSQLYHSRLYDT